MANSKTPSLFNNLDPNVKDQFDQLLGAAKPKITISEHAFVNRYLPMLYNFYTGEIGLDEISKYRTIWIDEVSKSGYNEVSIIDQAGNVLRVVPPVFGKVQYMPKEKGFNIASVMSNYSQIKRSRGDAKADTLFKGSMGNAWINRSAPVDQRWEELFNYYKCTPTENRADEEHKPNVIDYDLDQLTYEP